MALASPPTDACPLAADPATQTLLCAFLRAIFRFLSLSLPLLGGRPAPASRDEVRTTSLIENFCCCAPVGPRGPRRLCDGYSRSSW